MKELISLLICLLLPGLVSAQVFVSSSMGDDSNDGVSQQTPVRTIARAREIGKDIRLKCGDWFYENLDCTRLSIDCYGESSEGKPVLCGFRKVPAGKSTEIWERGVFDAAGTWHSSETGDIYRLNLQAEGIFEGYTDNAAQAIFRSENIGTIYDPHQDKLYGRKCQSVSEELFNGIEKKEKTRTSYKVLSHDMDFYQLRHKTNEEEAFKYLYVKASSPELVRGRELWLSVGQTAVKGHNLNLRNIRILGWGCHGVKAFVNVHISDCEIDIIGGSMHMSTPRWVRYGNGVEFWASTSHDSSCRNCRISRVYDTATTIQGGMSRDKGECRNIEISGNEIRNCRQDFEVWIKSADGTMPQNCLFQGNKGYDSGDNGFESQERNNTHILHYPNCEYPVKGIEISGNEFFGGAGLYYCRDWKHMPTGAMTYHCTLGHPILIGEKDCIICAPILENGKYKYASGIGENKEIVYAFSKDLKTALKKLQKTLGELSGNYEITICID